MPVYTANHIPRSIRPLEIDGRNYGYTQRCTVHGKWHYVAFGRVHDGDVTRYVPLAAAKTRAEVEAEARKLVASKSFTIEGGKKNG